MPRLVLTPVPGEGTHPWPALLAVADDLGSARAAIAAGADVIELSDATPADITAFLAAAPGVPFCAADDRAAVTWQAASAMTGGPALICPDLASVRASGWPADRVVILVPPAGIAVVRRAGYAAMVDADQAAAAAMDGTDAADAMDGTDAADSTEATPAPAEVAGCVAAAALSSWLGAAMIRTRHPVAVRRALDMAATIKGARPPARTVRGLA